MSSTYTSLRALEAARLTQEAANNSRVAGVYFTAVPILESGDR
jgi:hypothetical protein